MNTITTEAWVLSKGPKANGNGSKPTVGELRKESFSFPDINEDEVLVEPIYGCWESNMGHAMERQPIDICIERGEEKVVLGNSGIVRVLRTGRLVKAAHESDLCIVFGGAVCDKLGFMEKAYGYDAPNTVGLLAKRTKLHERQVLRIPKNTRYSLQQWAAFPVRYITAWANWKAALGCFRCLISEEECQDPQVWGWGGGTTLAELALAARNGYQTKMMASQDKRLELIASMGIEPIDRRSYRNLHYDEAKYQNDPEYRKAYNRADDEFQAMVRQKTNGRGVSIFVDYIGGPVARATLKALARPGIVTTAGWKGGMKISSMRAIECINWHVQVHTHYARHRDAIESMEFAERNGWMPHVDSYVYSWDNIPVLARDYADGVIDTYFPLFEVNSAY